MEHWNFTLSPTFTRKEEVNLPSSSPILGTNLLVNISEKFKSFTDRSCVKQSTVEDPIRVLDHPNTPNNTPATMTDTTESNPPEAPASTPLIGDETKRLLRKATTIVAGTSLIVAGIPLIPLPGPGDVMVLGGLVLLAKEFPAAQHVIDIGRDRLKDILAEDESEAESKSLQNQHEEVNVSHSDARTYIGAGEEEEEDNQNSQEEILNTKATLNSNSLKIPTSKEEMNEMFSQASDMFGKSVVKAKKSLKTTGRNTILPLVEKFASNSPTNHT